MRFPTSFTDRDHFGAIQKFLKAESLPSRFKSDVESLKRLRVTEVRFRSTLFRRMLASLTVRVNKTSMLLWREKLPADWLPKVLGNLPAVLVDHAHLERKAATTALNLEKHRALYSRVEGPTPSRHL